MTYWNACTAMMKADVNNKHVRFKKTRMTIEGRSNVVPMMTLLAIRFGSAYSDKWIISILDYHVKAIVARVKGFSPVSYECFDNCEDFCLDGNSNGIAFMFYDLEGILKEQLRITGNNHKKSMIKESEGILRTEVRLTKPKAIRAYTTMAETSGQIVALLKNDRDIFLDTFTRIIPFGNFYKKDKAEEIIRKRVEDSILRRKMLRLIALIPEKKSLYLAQKSMNCRDMEKVMDGFAKINVSPITISKRHDVKWLENIYEFLI